MSHHRSSPYEPEPPTEKTEAPAVKKAPAKKKAAKKKAKKKR